MKLTLALGAGSDFDTLDFDTLLTALAHHGVPARRTRELRDLVVRSTSVDDGQLLALLPIVELCLRLQDTEQLRARLGALRCDAYLLAGRIAFETRDDAAARRWYARAVAAPGDPNRRAAARTSYAMTVLHSTGARQIKAWPEVLERVPVIPTASDDRAEDR
jgi:hypothetical protein